ncbi:MAG TPA: RNA polymerase sigma factor [Candidatus Dormibacteraeota bacterium]|nr:RNA polymerase sigma factor [Candidatus Dormibacteraeota bacterium]
MIAGARTSTAPASELLLGRAAGGDAAAFDALIRPRLDKLFRMAMAITRSEADARDAVQEACVAAWRQLPRLREQDRFDSWLAQILVNACRAHLRRQRRAEVREIAVDGSDDAPAAGGFGTGGHGEQIAEVEAIRRAFERLDPDVRALLVLHYQEEQPLAEIARTLGAPVGTIKWRLSNARKALDRALKVERR